MELMEAISNRRAVREYSAQPVDEKIIRQLIDAAVHAPSAINEQPWVFTVVRDQTKLNKISTEAKAHMLATMGDDPRAPHFRSHLDSPDFQIFYHAPVLILISANEPSRWAVEDCTLAAQNLMLAAFGMGLGSCWIGFAQQYLNTSAGKKILDFPESWLSVAPIIVGYPTAFPPAVPRKVPLIHWVGKNRIGI